MKKWVNATMNKNELLKELMKYDFAVYELVLFLDTHPRDTKALEMYRSLVEKAQALRHEYENKFGPISSDMVKNCDHWTWIDSPWPWEN